MSSKRGFTLIELLAVIVVLAIILAIAVPSITSVIKNSTKKSFNSDAKMVLQAIKYKQLSNSDFNPLEITRENMMDTLGLSSENYEQISFSVVKDDVELLIVGQNKWKGLIAYGTFKNMKVVDNGEYDIVPPSITILGYNPINIGRGSIYVDAGATALDDVDGEVALTSVVIKNASGEVVENVDTSLFTNYTITYTSVDSQGNSSSSIRRVNIVDKTPPVITILGDNPVSIAVGSTYSDAGATALDDADGDVTSEIITVGTVNPSAVGTYTITYTVKDNANNQAVVTRTINVIDVTAPVITILEDNPATINVNSVYSDAGATAIDDVDGNITSKIVVTGTVNPSIIGTYTITYTVKDNANNQAVATRTVYVVDNVLPTVAFGMNGNATYSKSRSTTVTVSDNVSVNTSSLKYQWTTSTTAPTEVSFSTTFTNGGTINTPAGVTGGYYLWILAKDTNNNIMINRSNVFNLDNIAPIITLNGSNPVNIAVGSTYTDAGATATDAHSGIAGSVTATGTVNTNVAGTYTITYNVSDNAGNAATPVTRTINVIQTIFTYGYTGASQTFTVPMTGIYKIELWGAQGGNIESSLYTRGGYSKGNITLEKDETLYIYIGQAGTMGSNGINASNTKGAGAPATFNGGGAGGQAGGSSTYSYANYFGGPSGGGATDVRLVSGTWSNLASLRSRIMVAAGGGGGIYGLVDGTVVGYYTDGSYAGGLTGYKGVGIYYQSYNGNPVNKDYTTNGGAGGVQTSASTQTFGSGLTGANSGASDMCLGNAGGGGGYYGGYSGTNTGYDCFVIGGGGGSSFISGHTGCDAINSSGTHTGQPNHYSGKIFTNTVMIDGHSYSWTNVKSSQVQMPNPSGGSYSLGAGNSGNGYARITYLGE